MRSAPTGTAAAQAGPRGPLHEPRAPARPAPARPAPARAPARMRGWSAEQIARAAGARLLADARERASARRPRAGRRAGGPENPTTERGLPLAVRAAAADTQALVLEMAMRGAGQIAELTAIAEPDVGVIVNVGPAHLELLGSLEAIAAAKAELIAGLAAGATAVLPACEPLLDAHLRSDLRTITFGEGGDVTLLDRRAGGEVVVGTGRRSASGRGLVLSPSFGQPHPFANL